MSPVARAILSSWSLRPGLLAGVLVIAIVYARGWRRLRLPPARLYAFLSGLVALALAIASPVDALARFLLSVHMVQHLLLLAVAPPLLWLAAPTRVLLRGLPRALVREAVAPFLASPSLLRLDRALDRPIVGVAALTLATWGWHVPAAYELALRATGWHQLEHASFLGAALVFWRPVVASAREPRWSLVPCLLLADVQNTALSALLVFSDRVLYPSYATAPRLFGVSALDDQIIAGVIMWVPGSLVFLGPALVLCIRWLSPPARISAPARRAILAPPSPRFDLLHAPIVGPLLRARHGRRLLQTLCVAIAILVIVDGLRGPRAAPLNLAGTVPWIWWRALMVMALVAAGNLACMACPFTLPRALARRLGRATRSWPRALRGKWLAAALLAAFFVAQERLAWWDAPRATALLAIAYFVAAFAVDALVRGAAFCKYVCPIGQFQFIGSLVSPLEVKVRLPVVCADCEGKDCLRGNARQRGCEVDLFVPRKVGNLDCTFCLDCVKACPHDNIGILAVAPGDALLRDQPGASIGRLSQRLDLALLALVVVLAAFALAGVMVQAERAAHAVVIALFVAAALLFAGRVTLGRALFCRLALALVPLGMGMWAAHLAFHLATGWPSLVPILQRVMGRGDPDWSLACPGVVSDGLLVVQLLLLDAGLLLSLYLGWRIARVPRRYLGFALFAIALWLAGVWIVLQPMQMRGMLT